MIVEDTGEVFVCNFIDPKIEANYGGIYHYSGGFA